MAPAACPQGVSGRAGLPRHACMTRLAHLVNSLDAVLIVVSECRCWQLHLAGCE